MNLASLTAAAKRLIWKADWDESEHPRDEDGKFTDAGGGGGNLSSGATATAEPPSPQALKDEFKDLPRGYIGNLYVSDTAIELTAPARTTDARRAEYARLRDVSSRDSALRAMDSEKAWGTGWAVASDEWRAAQALGANDLTSKTTREAMKDPRNSTLDEKNLAAFRERQEIILSELREEHPTREITLYRGVKGAYAKKIPAVGEFDLQVYGLSSWTDHPHVAAEFAGKAGRIMKTTVKIEDIWLTGQRVAEHQILRFADQRGEYVVKTSAVTRKVSVVC